MDQEPEKKNEPDRSMLDYYGDAPAESGEGIPFRNRVATVAMEFVAGAVGLGMVVGLSEPGPVLRKLGACGVFIGGVVGAAMGMLALARRPLGYVDRSVAIVSVVLVPVG